MATHPSTIDWDLAERVAIRVAERAPFAHAHERVDLVADFERHTALAERLVAETTGLVPLHGAARARVVDRAAWIRANLASLQRLLRPMLERMADRPPGLLAPFATRISGAELGAVLGWMSTRVLGQYDLLVLEDEDAEDQDLVYYVGPNVVAIERRYAFPPDDFRLWLALHEAVAGPEQQAALDRIAGLMSLLEGHGDVTMDRAGEGHVRGADRFARVMRERRRSATGLVRLLQKVIGLEAKLAQYAQGEAFIAAVEAEGGTALLDRAWDDPGNLPDRAEIAEPSRWIERMAALAV